jgi:hypothetical protein
MGTEKGGPQVFNGMEGALIQHRFPVGLFEPDIEGGKHRGTELIPAGHEKPGFKAYMINLKTRYFFHNNPRLFLEHR